MLEIVKGFIFMAFGALAWALYTDSLPEFIQLKQHVWEGLKAVWDLMIQETAPNQLSNV